MDLQALSYGQIVYYAGIIMIGASVAALIIGLVVFAVKRKSLKEKLMDKYGF